MLELSDPMLYSYIYIKTVDVINSLTGSIFYKYPEWVMNPKQSAWVTIPNALDKRELGTVESTSLAKHLFNRV